MGLRTVLMYTRRNEGEMFENRRGSKENIDHRRVSTFKRIRALRTVYLCIDDC